MWKNTILCNTYIKRRIHQKYDKSMMFDALKNGKIWSENNCFRFKIQCSMLKSFYLVWETFERSKCVEGAVLSWETLHYWLILTRVWCMPWSGPSFGHIEHSKPPIYIKINFVMKLSKNLSFKVILATGIETFLEFSLWKEMKSQMF